MQYHFIITMTNIIVGDADCLIAVVNIVDEHHERAKSALVKIAKNGVRVYFPVTAIAEALTTFQRKLSNSELTAKLFELCRDKKLLLLAVDQEIISLAGPLFKPTGSKKNTFFDAIVAATAIKYKTRIIFSFDSWYEKKGFVLAYKI